MPSIDNRSRDRSDSVPMPGMPGKSALSGEPVSVEEHSIAPLPALQQNIPGQETPSGGQLVPTMVQQPDLDHQDNPNVTRVLPGMVPGNTRIQSGLLGTTSQRLPVVIKGSMKKPLPVQRPHTKRRVVVSLVGVLMLFLVIGLTFLSVSPLGHDIGLNINAQFSSNNLIKNSSTNPSHLIAQATATAVFHQQNDGYSPSSGSGQSYSNGEGSLDWPVGQCTFWANYRYHQLTGFWVSWSGNADQWVAGARGAGWNVSQTPHVPSIIVLMPGVQGASSYGHVAVVESMVNSTTVHTSNMNWYANGGGFDVESYQDFTVGSGVYFIWHS
jgi:surface antigen